MRLKFLGSGDAFGSGGRFNTCFLLTGASARCLVDFGASSLIALRRYAIDPNSIPTILISHLHGDHFGGLPFLLLDAHLVSRRTAPLTIAGPPGLRDRPQVAMEAFFPGSSTIDRRHPLEIIEMTPQTTHRFGGVSVTPYLVHHFSGAPPFALRIEAEGKIFAYSGDTEWVDTVIDAARGADLFVSEAYFFDKVVKYHVDYATLARHLPEIAAKRVFLTHMSAELLGRLAAVDPAIGIAEDGLDVDF